MKTSLAIIYLIIILTFSSCINFSELKKEPVYLIPTDYVGAIIITSDKTNGISPKLKDNSYYYEIPSSGILKIKSQLSYKANIDNFYYATSSHQKGKKIEYFESQESYSDKDSSMVAKEKANEIYVMHNTPVSFNIDKKTITFISFVVGRPSDTEQLLAEKQHKISAFIKTFE